MEDSKTYNESLFFFFFGFRADDKCCKTAMTIFPVSTCISLSILNIVKLYAKFLNGMEHTIC